MRVICEKCGAIFPKTLIKLHQQGCPHSDTTDRDSKFYDMEETTTKDEAILISEEQQ